MGSRKMSRYFIGIDPGKSGAIAIIDSSGEIVIVKDWPGDEIQTARFIRDMLNILESDNIKVSAALEKVSAMPKQGVRSMFTFGCNYGIWKGILASFQIPFQEVTPQKWQKGVVSKKQDGKKASVAAAGRMFPSAELHGPRGGAKDGRADALLIADWARRNYTLDFIERKRR